MADNTTQTADANMRTTDDGTAHHQHIILGQLLSGTPTEVDATNALNVTAPSALPVSTSAPFSVTNYLMEVARGNVSGVSSVHKFGKVPDVDTADGFVAVWNGTKGDYLGHNATAGEAVEVFSSDAADAGTLVSSGTATGGSATTIVDTGATFSTDGVAAGDLLINDTNLDHGVIASVDSETQLTVHFMENMTTNAASDSYRVATAASTGAAVVRLDHLIVESTYAQTSEYVILNGTTGVDTTGTDYIRNHRCYIILAGSGGGNAGTITTRQTTTTANIYALIPVGNNQTVIAAYTIPAGKVGYVVFGSARPGNKTTALMNVRFKVRPRGEVFRVVSDTTASAQGPIERVFPLPMGPFPEQSDIVVECDTNTNNAGLSAEFSLVMFDI